MTAKDPKPARRIPDEGLFTVHFLNVGHKDLTFNAQMPIIDQDHLTQAIARRSPGTTTYLSYHFPTKTSPGQIYGRRTLIGHFTITPPTLKGDPDEPT